MKAAQIAALSVGWHTRNFKYVKKLESLGDYLKPEPTPEQRRDHGAAKVAAMFDRLVAK